MDRLSFVHPVSRTPLHKEGDALKCAKTGDVFPYKDGIPCFVPEALQAHMNTERQGLENAIKTVLRYSPLLYRFLIFVISPVCFTGMSAKRFAKKFGPDAKGLNVGAGVHTFHKNIINLDIFPYANVDVIANAECMPFADGTFDLVICESLLEHVPRPQLIVDEMMRVLKPGGELFIVVPFIYPFHASPNDFQRWTETGLRTLCKAGEHVHVGVRAGVSSALMAALSTWGAVVLSFGLKPLYNIFSLLLPLVLWPIKFLDLLFGWYPTAKNGANQFYVIVRKSKRA